MSRARELSKLGNINALAVDTTDTEVGIASTVPSSTLDVRGEVKIGTAVQLGVAGVVTATSFSGSGSNLTGLATTETVRTDTLTVAGVSTLTGAVNIDATTDSTSTSTGALIVDGGAAIAKNVYIGAGLSVAGTLTYEDVTNVDSVGLITAKSGVNVSGGQLAVGVAYSVGAAGVATAAGFVGPLTGAVTGNADTATLATSVTVTANNSTDETVYPIFVDGATGTQGAESDTGLTYNPSDGNLTSTTFTGALTGNVTGTASNASGATGDFSIADKIVHTGDTNTAIRFSGADTITAETGGSERLRLDSSGRLLIGQTSADADLGSNLQVAGSSYAAAGILQARLTADQYGPALDLLKSRNTTWGTHTIVQDGDQLGRIYFRGDDGSDYGNAAAAIFGEVDGTPGADDMPGRLVFYTSADGSVSVTERMRLDSSGHLKFNQTQSKISNNTSDGSDDKYLSINGGGDASQTRGAGITFYGNEVGSNEGRLWLGAGNSGSANGFINFNTGGAERARIDSSGRLLLGTTTEGNASADDLTIANSGHGGITIRSGDTAAGYIMFSDATSGSGEYAGYIQYHHDDNDLKLYTNGGQLSLTLDSSQNATFAGSVSDSKGDVRQIVYQNKTSGYTLVAADAGKAIHISTGGVTINNSLFSAGDAVTIINNSGSSQTITQGSGVTLYNTGDSGSTGNKTLAGRGMCTVWFSSASVAYISGNFE